MEELGSAAAAEAARRAAARVAIAAAAAASTSFCPEPKDPCKGLRRQYNIHLKKLQNYIKDPDKYDNLDFLKQPIVKKNPELRDKIIDSRIKRLLGQINNFRKQLEECEKVNGLR